MGDEPADALLVCEVDTPPGHWSSYPPHKHDRDALPDESQLEETYYFRVDLPQGFGLHRVYSATGSTRRSRCATATPCWCRTATTRSRRRPATASVTARDGRPGARLGRRRRPRPRLDEGVDDPPPATRARGDENRIGRIGQ